jgi:hypothetical protein
MNPVTPERRRFARRNKLDGPPDGVEERRYCDDRRHDIESRERIEWLEVRYRRVTELLIGSLVVTLLVVTVGFVVVGNQADDLKKEVALRAADTKARVSESCTISETKQKRDVQQLRDTYRYLVNLSSEELAAAKAGRGINGAIYQNLGRTEADAYQDDAPKYCDDPNVGLPEPDPEVPARPQKLR